MLDCLHLPSNEQLVLLPQLHRWTGINFLRQGTITYFDIVAVEFVSVCEFGIVPITICVSSVNFDSACPLIVKT